jgi:hypothetical protein
MKISIHQIKETQCPVWENDAMTGAYETRVLVVFRKDKELNGLSCGTALASIFMLPQYTLEQVQTALPLDVDYAKKVEFVAKPDSKYFKAVIL